MRATLAAAAAVFISTTGASMAADLAAAYTKAPQAAVYSWTGFYIDGNLGGGWEDFHITDNLTGATFNSNTRAAFIGSGQAGYNFQVGPFVVLGVEGFWDAIASNNNNSGQARSFRGSV